MKELDILEKTESDFSEEVGTLLFRRASLLCESFSVIYLLFFCGYVQLFKLPAWLLPLFGVCLAAGIVIVRQKNLSHTFYKLWFSLSSAAVCGLCAVLSPRPWVGLAFFAVSVCFAALFRDEHLMCISVVEGTAIGIACVLINHRFIFENAETAVPFISAALVFYGGCAVCFFSIRFSRLSEKMLSQRIREKEAEICDVRRKQETAEHAADCSAAFLADMSHELRSPINGIIGMTELEMRDELSPQAQQCAEKVHKAALSLLTLVNDILDYSKLGAGKTELALGEYSIVSVVDEVCAVVSPKIDSNVVQLITHISPETPAVLIGDSSRIRQILLNLTDNAVKYTRHGTINISVSAKPDDVHTILCIEVRDTGIGISAGDMGRIFDAYEQADLSRRSGAEGTGLGLPICKKLTALMGGTLTAESAYGAGSTFRAEIPQDVADASPCIRREKTAGKNILVSFSDKEQLLAISAELSSLGICHTKTEDFRNFAKNELCGFTDIVIDYYDYVRAGGDLRGKSGAAVTVVAAAGTRLSLGGSVRVLYKPVTALALLELFGDADGICSKKEAIIAPEAKVLLTDDNNESRLITAQFLSEYGISPDIAKNGVQAIRMVRENDYDLVLMDRIMPELDGLKAAAVIRNLDGEKYKKVPIIALTAVLAGSEDFLYREAGMNGFLTKPIEKSRLDEVLRRYIPKEKQLPAPLVSYENEQKEPYSPFLDSLSDIDGLDAKTAFAGCGEEETLCSVLSAMAAPETVYKLENMFSSGSFSDYAIYVHGLKGTLRSLGMTEMAELAELIEQEAKLGGCGGLRDKHIIFTQKLRRFSEQFAKAVGTDTDKDAPARFRRLLKQLRAALSAEDFNESARLADELTGFSCGEEIELYVYYIGEIVGVLDYNRALTYADKIERLLESDNVQKIGQKI